MLHASLNKLPFRCADDTAKEHCSSAAIRRKVCAFLTQADMDCGMSWQADFAACLDDPAQAAGARALLADIADDMSEIIWTLKRGASACARPDWASEHWRFWEHIHRFYLAGGLLHGRMGTALTAAVRDSLDARGLSGVEICLSDHPSVISLIGAAKYAAALQQDALVLDFGHSFVKQGYTVHTNDGYVVYNQPMVRAKWTEWECASEHAECAAARALSDFVQDTIADLWQAAASHGHAVQTAVVSIANYVQNGCLVSRGGYGKLRRVAQPYDRLLSRALSARLGRPFTVHLLHDGTAGAYGTQGAQWEREAFIGFGTSLSVGFPSAQMDFPFRYTVVDG